MKEIKTIAELKRLPEGTKIKLVECIGIENHKGLNIIREIDKIQTNSLKFSGGSWLYFPKSKDFKSWENGFIIYDGMDSKYPVTLKYEVLE